MTRWSARTILVLLVLLLLISISIRFPLVEHERCQTDSYFIHHLADSIASDSRAKWIFHPLSCVGYFPISYPSGVPFILAEFSIMSGLTIDVSILLMDMIVAAIFCLGVFMLARHFVRRPEFAILAAYFAVLGSRFVDTTYWDGSARGVVIPLMVLTVVVILDAGFILRARWLVIGSILVVGSISCHHMAILLILFGAAYVITSVMTRCVFRHLNTRRRATTVSVIILTLSVIIISPFVLFDYFWESAIYGMQDSSLFQFESEVLTVILVGATSYLNQIGFILIPAAAYVPVLLAKSRMDSRNLFPIFLIAVFLPLLGDTLYISMIISPFIAILGVLWFDRALSGERLRKRIRVLLVLLLVVSIAHPLWSVSRWNNETFSSGDQVLVGDDVFNDASYAAFVGGQTPGLCNVILVRNCLETLSGVGFLGSGILLAMNDDVIREDVLEGLDRGLSDFPRSVYKWYEYSDAPPVDKYVRFLMTQGVAYLSDAGVSDGASEYFSGHSNMLVVIDNRWPSSYVTHDSAYGAVLPQELLMGVYQIDGPDYSAPRELPSYVCYQSDSVTMYLVQLPANGS